MKKERYLQKKYSFISEYNEKRVVFGESPKENGEYAYGYLDEKGRKVIPESYTVAEAFIDDLAIVAVGEIYNPKYGVINSPIAML